MDEGIKSWDLKRHIPHKKNHYEYIQSLRAIGLNLGQHTSALIVDEFLFNGSGARPALFNSLLWKNPPELINSRRN